MERTSCHKPRWGLIFIPLLPFIVSDPFLILPGGRASPHYQDLHRPRNHPSHHLREVYIPQPPAYYFLAFPFFTSFLKSLL